jgi:hypothetical protein
MASRGVCFSCRMRTRTLTVSTLPREVTSLARELLGVQRVIADYVSYARNFQFIMSN